jgi:SRSO17 transposase
VRKHRARRSLIPSPTATLSVNCGTLLLQSMEEAYLAAEKHRSGGDELAIIERWPDALGELHARIVHRFLRPEVGERARRYLAGLLGRVGRKNGWQLAEQMGETGPQGAQRFLNAARWDADAVRDDLREYVVEHLGEEETGVLVVDETGFLKKGEKSVGVARQYTGTAGRIENAQVGVFLAYASEKGAAFVDRALYLPREEWVDDPIRRVEAGVPDGVRFATKGELAKEMLGRAFEAEVPARWVVADTVYGTARGLRGWLEKQGRSYVLAVPGTKGVYHEGRQRQARSLAKDLPGDVWARASAGAGSKGERLYDWALVSLPEPEASGAGRWLLVRRSIGDPTELAYYLAYGPKETPAEELVRVAGRRWAIEDCFEQAKGEVGLDEYEVRKWEAWHRHITFCLLAHAYLAVLRSNAAKRGMVAPK